MDSKAFQDLNWFKHSNFSSLADVLDIYLIVCECVHEKPGIQAMRSKISRFNITKAFEELKNLPIGNFASLKLRWMKTEHFCTA